MRVEFTCLKFEPKLIEDRIVEEYSGEEALNLYRLMVRIRAFEEALLRRYEDMEIRGELHLSIGQEAVAAGIVSAMDDKDYLVSTHRSHGHLISKGVSLKDMAAEIYGRKTGLCRGKGGHMHLIDVKRRVLTTGIVGAGIPIGAGLAFASKYLGENAVAVVFIGDGAANQGTFHETLNLASVWRLPLVLVVEDNRYGFSLRKEESTAVEYNAQRAVSYDIANYEVLDGNDVLQVNAVARRAIGEAREEGKPVLVEVRTYRLRPHLEIVDVEQYRSEEEKEEWTSKDPILKLETRLLSEGVVSREELDAIKRKAREEAEEAIKHALESPLPRPEEAYEDLYAPEPEVGEYSAREGSRIIGMYEAINEAIAQEMERDERVILLGEDVGRLGGAFWCTQGLLERFGSKRVLDTPISESAFVGLAIGAAAAGLRPIVEIQMVDFSLVAMDQLLNHMAKLRYMSGGQLRLPIVVRAPIGGGYGDAAQHSQVLYSLFAHVPGLYVVAPSNPYDAKGMLISAVRSDNPVIFLEHKLLYGLPYLPPGSFSHVPEEPYTVPLGRARVVKEGSDVTVVAVSLMVHYALEAAEKLKGEVSVEVLDLRSIVPLDREAIRRSVQKTGRLVVVDEDYMSFGLSGEVIATVTEDPETLNRLKAPIVRICNPDLPIPFSEPLEREVIPSTDRIVEGIRRVMG